MGITWLLILMAIGGFAFFVMAVIGGGRPDDSPAIFVAGVVAGALIWLGAVLYAQAERAGLITPAVREWWYDWGIGVIFLAPFVLAFVIGLVIFAVLVARWLWRGR